MSLSESFVRNVKPRAKTWFYPDGRNSLRLRVQPSGSKCWTQRIVIQRKRRDMGLGQYPYVSLADARQKAFENLRIAKSGGNPMGAHVSFDEVDRATLKLDAPSWKTARQRKDVEVMMDRHAASLYRLPVSEVQTHHVMDLVEPIWHSKAPTANKLLQRLGRIFDYAIAKGYRKDNPASSGVIKAALPKQGNGNGSNGITHHEALPYAELPAALRKVNDSAAREITKLMIRFIALTAVRIGEARLAEWSEIDLEGAVWTIPADRMKAGREHRVPLADEALRVLETVAPMRAQGCRLIFGSSKGKALGSATTRKLFQSLGIGTVHGLRSTFRDWASECTDAPKDVLERCLAHTVRNRTEAAYHRTDLLDKRREVMEAWARFVSG